MSFGEGLVSGLRTGAAIRDSREERELKRRAMQQQLEREQKQREWELEKLRQEFEGRRGLTELDATLRGAENEKDRGWRTGERVGTQTHQSDQAERDRQTRTLNEATERSHRGTQAMLERDLRNKGMNLEDSFRNRSLDTQEAVAGINASTRPNPNTHRQVRETGDDGTVRTYWEPRESAGAAATPPSARATQSAYSPQIEKLRKELEDHEVELTKGDPNYGFFNGKERPKRINELKTQITRMEALHLADLVRRGVITEEEADRQAAAMLPKG
jgi:hypothetical protein